MNTPGPVDNRNSPLARLRALPLGAVKFRPGFWRRYQQLNHTTSLAHGYRMLERNGNFHDLRLAAGLAEGDYRGFVFMDSDVHKWLEALAWAQTHGRDANLQHMADEVIGWILAAQQPDGYINSYYTVAEPQKRWQDLAHGHELYCAGHLFQAAVAFARVTGDNRLLNASRRFADLIANTFAPGKTETPGGHPEIEMALVELYRQTGERQYLEQAKFFLDVRGRKQLTGWYGPANLQDHVPVREATTVEGHTVRQLYLTAGMTDLYLETGEGALWEAMMRQWQDMTTGKMYLTGGLGSRFDGEAFGEPYELPDDRAYCETCTAIASVMWNWRLLLASGEARYADLLEQTLFNGMLAGPGLDGTSWFYMNPLLVRQPGYTRPDWHSCACCPPNVMRLFASLEHYFITADETGIQLHQYTPLEVNHQGIALQVATDYPWQGIVTVTIQQPGEFSLSLRQPGWCPAAHLSINGSPAAIAAEDGYFRLNRAWQAGDAVTLDLSMPPTFVAPHPRLDAQRGSLAIQRGPLVYCLEEHDQPVPGERFLDLRLDESIPLAARWADDLPGGLMAIEAQGELVEYPLWGAQLYAPPARASLALHQPVRLTAIPYYAWGNRGAARMRVWIPRRS